MNPRRHIALGLLFLASLTILSYYTLFKTDFSLFQQRQEIVAYAENARGLRKGAPVLYAGVRWGKVEPVAPDLERPRDERVRLDVVDSNPRAKALFQHIGFKEVKTVKTGLFKYIVKFNAATTMVLDL